MVGLGLYVVTAVAVDGVAVVVDNVAVDAVTGAGVVDMTVADAVAAEYLDCIF